jgi:hypothetical protein
LVRNHPGDERWHWLDLVSAYLRVYSRTIKGIILHSPLEKRRTGSRRNQTYETALRRLLLAVQQKEDLLTDSWVPCAAWE